jgi:hypothetical protein
MIQESLLMPHSNQEHTARRFQSFDIQNGADYDCELPRNFRTELVTPRRPHILGRKTQSRLKSATKWPHYLAVLIAALVVGGLIARWRQEETAERAKTSKAILQPTPAQEPPPQAVPTPEHPYDDWKSYFAAHQTGAPRAALVKLPPPRAQLVALPSAWPPLFVGGRYLATMPYDNLEVLATFRGGLRRRTTSRHTVTRIGDTHMVNGVPFVWILPPAQRMPPGSIRES